MGDDITLVASDDRITRRERQWQSEYREHVLRLPAGRRGDRVLGNYLLPEEWRSNFLSREAADYAGRRAEDVQREGGQLEATRLFTNMLSSMPLRFDVFGHLRAHRTAAVRLLSDLLDLDIAAMLPVRVGSRGSMASSASGPQTGASTSTTARSSTPSSLRDAATAAAC